MNSYYVDYPRNFGNEYTVYATTDPEAFEAVFPDARKITRKEAIRLGWSRPRQATKYGEQWYGGFAGAGEGFGLGVEGAIEDCLVATRRRMAEVAATA